MSANGVGVVIPAVEGVEAAVGVMVDQYHSGGGRGGGVVAPDLSCVVGGDGVVAPDLSGVVGGDGVVAPDHSGVVGGGGVVAPDHSGGEELQLDYARAVGDYARAFLAYATAGAAYGRAAYARAFAYYAAAVAAYAAVYNTAFVPAMDGKGGGRAGSYYMILAPADPTGALELSVDFGDYLYNDRGAPGFITVRERLDENSPRLVFDVRYRAYKHRAYVTKKTWSGFAADHGLQGGDEMSFEEHGDAFLLTAQRNGVALW